MPKQENYGQKIEKTWGFRPRRIDDRDWDLIVLKDKNGNPIEEDVTFGTTTEDIAEIWIYDDANQIVGHLNLHPWDEAIRLSKYSLAPTDMKVGLGQDETPDIIEINWPNVMTRLKLPQGRYFASINFFRNEVGSETHLDNDEIPGNKLFISAISPSRTELRLEPVQRNNTLANQIYEFAFPSVPPYIAQALIDQLLAHGGVTASFIGTEPSSLELGNTITTDFSLNANMSEMSIADRVSDVSRGYSEDINSRLQQAGLVGSWQEFLNRARLTLRNKIINGLQEALDSGDIRIQENQLQEIIDNATSASLNEIKSFLKESIIAGRITLVDM